MFSFNLRLLISKNVLFLFQQFRLGCRTVWRDCRTGSGEEDEIGRGIWRQLYGPSLSLEREPFINERYLFSDSQYHTCGPYLDMEKKFFSDNAAIVREVFFDTNDLLGVDSEEDLNVEEAVNYEDLVPVLSAEEI